MLGDVKMVMMKATPYTIYNDFIMLGLDQLICEVKHPESKSCLDHVYANNRTNVLTSSVASIGLSDHCPVTVVRKHNGNVRMYTKRSSTVILNTLMNIYF